VPRSLAGDVQASVDFMEKMSPATNTCNSKSTQFGGMEFTVPDSGGGMMYFYPDQQ
jgi:hypothetical protein